MCKYQLMTLLLVAIGFLGCSLKGAPDCVSGDEQCHNDVLEMGVYQICTLNQEWGSPLVCGSSCDGDKCGEGMSVPGCQVDGEMKCVEVDNEDLAVLLVCQGQHWIPQICASGRCSEDQGCLASDPSCEEGQGICIKIPQIGSLQVNCSDNHWMTKYCPSGWVCHNNVCTDESAIAYDCDEICDIPNASKLSCDTGECILKSCNTGYHVYQNACEKDDLTNCGEHGNACTVDGKSKATSVSCESGYCRIESCEEGYCVNSSRCMDVKMDMDNCGSCGNKCSEVFPDVLTQCDNGVCVKNDCGKGKHFYDGACVANDNENCGSHGYNCELWNSAGHYGYCSSCNTTTFCSFTNAMGITHEAVCPENFDFD